MKSLPSRWFFRTFKRAEPLGLLWVVPPKTHQTEKVKPRLVLVFYTETRFTIV